MTGMEREKLPVLLSIRGEQYFDDIDPDATELMTDGTLEVTEDGGKTTLFPSPVCICPRRESRTALPLRLL